jgi:hypothetical protein
VGSWAFTKVIHSSIKMHCILQIHLASRAWVCYRLNTNLDSIPDSFFLLGVHLTELARTEAAAPVIIEKSAQINFAQLQKTAEIIRDIQQYQNISYSLQPVPELQEYILVNLQAASDAGEPEPKNLEAELLSSPAAKSGRETPDYFGWEARYKTLSRSAGT